MKIAFTGPESSGKTTMAEIAAKLLEVDFVAEYAREFLSENKGVYHRSDLDLIAEKQFSLFMQDVQHLVADTEMLVLKIWSADKYKEVSELIERYFAAQHFDHYFLCQPDIPWEADPMRENPTDRDRLFELYLNELNQRDCSFTVLSGSIEQRTNQMAAVLSVLK